MTPSTLNSTLSQAANPVRRDCRHDEAGGERPRAPSARRPGSSDDERGAGEHQGPLKKHVQVLGKVRIHAATIPQPHPTSELHGRSP